MRDSNHSIRRRKDYLSDVRLFKKNNTMTSIKKTFTFDVESARKSDAFREILDWEPSDMVEWIPTVSRPTAYSHVNKSSLVLTREYSPP